MQVGEHLRQLGLETLAVVRDVRHALNAAKRMHQTMLRHSLIFVVDAVVANSKIITQTVLFLFLN